jgi:hypothetical protein
MKQSTRSFLFFVFLSLPILILATSAMAASSGKGSGNMTSMSGPTRTITQEMGGVISDGEVNLDMSIFDGTGFYQGETFNYMPAVQINMGIWKGELRLGGAYGTESTPGSSSIGYKFIAGPGAAYGRLNFNQVSPSPKTVGNPQTADFDLSVGYAFSQDLQNMIVNLNGELTIDSNSADNGAASTSVSATDIKLNGAILLPLIPKLHFIGELGFDSNSNPNKTTTANSASALVIGLGLRLNPNSKVTVDGMVLSYASLSGNGKPYDSISGIGTPVLLRANYQF